MRIAIIGAGFAGLATAWHLFKKPPQPIKEIVLFDKVGIGGGASGVAAGLMHPFPGAKAAKSWRADEGLAATLELLNVSSTALGKPVFEQSGILRMAVNEEQQNHFLLCAQKNDGVEWLNQRQMQERIPNALTTPGLFIKDGFSVYCDSYLSGLWEACQRQGLTLLRKNIYSLDEVSDFDLIIVTAGENAAPLAGVPLKPLKGQILEFNWPKDLPPLPMPITSHIYLVMSQDHQRCYAGSTFERTFSSPDADPEYAASIILPKLTSIFPAFKDARPLACKAGIRAMAPSRLPVVKQISQKCWVITGLGSKGLLYHALCAQDLVEQINKRSERGQT